MNILLLGGGGREHALAWKLSQSRLTDSLYIMPGNPGTQHHGETLEGNPLDFDRVKDVVLSHNITMVVVGPEEPLVRGIHDFFLGDPQLAGVQVVGPQAAGARLEGSKAFAKEFMVRHGIPTAVYKVFAEGEVEAAEKFLSLLTPPYVLKADGLAAGKGVLIHTDYAEACRDVSEILQGDRFGEAGKKLVIEEFLSGIEASVFVLTDGDHYLLLPEAKDYKRIGEGDTGPNTGGMGSLSPVPFFNDALRMKVVKKIIEPTIQGLRHEGIPYSGFIFFGLMVVNGDPYVIEYNVRMGDPEAESVIPRLSNDLAELMSSLGNKTLDRHDVKVDPRCAATVMMVSEGYPGDYTKGHSITLPDDTGDALIFHAGTKAHQGSLVTNGGRVLAVTSMGQTLPDALSQSFQLANKIDFRGCYYRKDLGFDLF